MSEFDFIAQILLELHSNLAGFSIFSPIFYKKFVLVFRLKEKRTAAYELAAMAASGDDNKFRIVAEDGYVLKKQ